MNSFSVISFEKSYVSSTFSAFFNIYLKDFSYNFYSLYLKLAFKKLVTFSLVRLSPKNSAICSFRSGIWSMKHCFMILTPLFTFTSHIPV